MLFKLIFQKDNLLRIFSCFTATVVSEALRRLSNSDTTWFNYLHPYARNSTISKDRIIHGHIFSGYKSLLTETSVNNKPVNMMRSGCYLAWRHKVGRQSFFLHPLLSNKHLNYPTTIISPHRIDIQKTLRRHFPHGLFPFTYFG